MPISTPLLRFFEAEERNTRQAIAQGDLDVDHPLNLSTALNSLRQASPEIQILWLTGIRPQTAAEMDEVWGDAFDALLELTTLFDHYGGDKSLYELMEEAA